MIEFNTLYWDNIPKEMIDAHKRVMSHFGIPVNYTSGNMDHGWWMDNVMELSEENIIGFFDIDCVPISKEKLEECINFVIKNDTFLGSAQVSNHIAPYTHIFAAPSFFIITKKCWERLGKPSFRDHLKWDVAEKISIMAEKYHHPYRCIYPTYFEDKPTGEVWRLHNYGFFGLGTVFDSTVYHLFQGRFESNNSKFVKHCDEIINGEFNTNGFFKSTDLNCQV